MNDHPLIGKCIKSTKNVSLKYCLVDNEIRYPNQCWVPWIKEGWKFLVKDCYGDKVLLQNLSSDEWSICEISEEDIEDFKVVSMSTI